MKNAFGLLILFVLSLAAVDGVCQLNPETVQIPMRDGRNLSAHVYRPNQNDQFPVILIQTPYNKNFFKNNGLPLGVGQDIASSPYVFVVVDWRCFYGSLLACTANPDRGEDGYDAVEWIAQKAWCNGKIGTWGPSALGNVQFQTAYENPPHLVCAVPEVPSPQTHYQLYYPGGSIRTEYVETLNILFGIIGGFDLVIQNPYYSALWQYVESITLRPELIHVPMLIIGGWYDHNTSDDVLLIDTLSKASPIQVRNKHKILIGPWVHGGTGLARVGSEVQGELNYPDAAGWNDSLALEFFDYYLRDVDRGWESRNRYTYFQMGENQWKQSTSWPISGLAMQTFYLHDNGGLNTHLPQSEEANLSFAYDPEDPSPTVGGKTLNFTLDQGPYDQRTLVESREDNLIFSTAPLPDDLAVKGTIKIHLYVSSDRLDTDFAVRITEVYPDGRSMLLGSAIQRMRFREGYRASDTTFMQKDEIYPVTLILDPLAVTFKSGHRIRVILTSSNYPRYNRNMNTGLEMYPNGNIDTLVNPLVAFNRVHMDKNYPSRIELPVENTIITSLDELPDHSKKYSIYPNPAEDYVQISDLYGNGHVELLQLNGAAILSANIDGPIMTINTSRVPPGMYVLKIYAGNPEYFESHLLMIK